MDPNVIEASRFSRDLEHAQQIATVNSTTVLGCEHESGILRLVACLELFDYLSFEVGAEQCQHWGSEYDVASRVFGFRCAELQLVSDAAG